LNRAAYWRELIKLADLDDQTEAANEADRVVALRGRIATLERRVRELEARK
jgi:polyhydroxyalkanoate synthesis regulator phasin